MLHHFFALCALSFFPELVHGAVRFRHEALGVQRQQHQHLAQQLEKEQELEKRQLVIPSIATDVLESLMTLAIQQATPSPAVSSSAPISTVYSYYYPSPSASPTPITQQSQVVTTYIPKLTTCKGPIVALDIAQQTTYPFLNLTSTIYGNAPVTCDTLYYTDTTTLCATTLTGVASRVTISECTQGVTFSSEFGTTLITSRSTITGINGERSTITASPSLQLRTTYYLAPWQSLTANPGTLPTDVDVKVCHQRPGNDTMEDCIRMEESWVVLPVTLTSTYTSAVDLLVTLTEGPGQYVVGTVSGNFVGNATIVSLSTEMILNYAYEAETISRGPRIGPFATTPETVPAIATATGSGVSGVSLPTIRLTSTTTRTRTVVVASSTGINGEETTIVTTQSTQTVFAGTSTMIMDENLPVMGTSTILFAETLSPIPVPVQTIVLDPSHSMVLMSAPSGPGTPESQPLASEPVSEIQSPTPALLLAEPTPILSSDIQSPPASALLLAETTPILSSDIQPSVWTPQSVSVTESPTPGESPNIGQGPAILQGISLFLFGPSQSTTPEATPTPQWTPQFTPVMESLALSETSTSILVPSPLVLGTPSGFFLGSQPTALESSSVFEVVTPSAAPLRTPSSSIKWFNTTTSSFS